MSKCNCLVCCGGEKRCQPHCYVCGAIGHYSRDCEAPPVPMEGNHTCRPPASEAGEKAERYATGYAKEWGHPPGPLHDAFLAGHASALSSLRERLEKVVQLITPYTHLKPVKHYVTAGVSEEDMLEELRKNPELIAKGVGGQFASEALTTLRGIIWE